MEKFTEIGQFRNVIREVKSNYDYRGDDTNGNPIYIHDAPYPTFRFRGTVKLHGTNSGIGATKTENGVIYHFQSRERILSLEEDNAGFMAYMVGVDYQSLFNGIEYNETCVIYGEWCGGNIQKKVALNQLQKMFVVIAIRIDGRYVDLINYKHVKNEALRIYNILDFPYYEIDIDFNHPELVQNKLIEIMEEVERECPVSKQLGAIGTGEGVVWEVFHPEQPRRYIFKVKGEKHANKSKVKTLKPVDNEFINKCIGVAEQVTPAWRLDQMMNLACDTVNGGFIDRKHLGTYLKMVIADVQKEDMDIIEEAGLKLKDVAKYISQIGKEYFFKQELDNL